MFKKKLFIIIALLFSVNIGCARTIQFGEGESESGLQLYSLFSNIMPGMTESEVKERIGSPSVRNHDVEYQGMFYDEQWIYRTTSPITVLYFKNEILEVKDYQY